MSLVNGTLWFWAGCFPTGHHADGKMVAGDGSAALLGFLAGTLLAVVIVDVEAIRQVERKFTYGNYLTQVKLLWPGTLRDKGNKGQRGSKTKGIKEKEKERQTGSRTKGSKTKERKDGIKDKVENGLLLGSV